MMIDETREVADLFDVPEVNEEERREAAIKNYRKVVRRLIEDRRRYHEHNTNKDAANA